MTQTPRAAHVFADPGTVRRRRSMICGCKVFAATCSSHRTSPEPNRHQMATAFRMAEASLRAAAARFETDTARTQRMLPGTAASVGLLAAGRDQTSCASGQSRRAARPVGRPIVGFASGVAGPAVEGVIQPHAGLELLEIVGLHPGQPERGRQQPCRFGGEVGPRGVGASDDRGDAVQRGGSRSRIPPASCRTCRARPDGSRTPPRCHRASRP